MVYPNRERPTSFLDKKLCSDFAGDDSLKVQGCSIIDEANGKALSSLIGFLIEAALSLSPFLDRASLGLFWNMAGT